VIKALRCNLDSSFFNVSSHNSLWFSVEEAVAVALLEETDDVIKGDQKNKK